MPCNEMFNFRQVLSGISILNLQMCIRDSDTTAGLSNSDILSVQLKEFNRVMSENVRHPGRKIVFIHGKGEGVLRNAILKELKHKYKTCTAQDASFREYGFGATQVTIR